MCCIKLHFYAKRKKCFPGKSNHQKWQGMKKEVFVTFHITPFLLLLCLFFIMQIPKVGEKFTFVRFTQWCILSQHVEWEIFRNCYKKSYLLGKIWHLTFFCKHQFSIFHTFRPNRGNYFTLIQDISIYFHTYMNSFICIVNMKNQP